MLAVAPPSGDGRHGGFRRYRWARRPRSWRPKSLTGSPRFARATTFFMDRTPLRLGPDHAESNCPDSSGHGHQPQCGFPDRGRRLQDLQLGWRRPRRRRARRFLPWAGPLERFGEEGQARSLVRLSEEHGFIPRNGPDLPLGACLRFIPNHACPVVNLTDRLLVREGDAVHRWPVDARGRTR